MTLTHYLTSDLANCKTLVFRVSIVSVTKSTPPAIIRTETIETRRGKTERSENPLRLAYLAGVENYMHHDTPCRCAPDRVNRKTSVFRVSIVLLAKWRSARTRARETLGRNT